MKKILILKEDHMRILKEEKDIIEAEEEFDYDNIGEILWNEYGWSNDILSQVNSRGKSIIEEFEHSKYFKNPKNDIEYSKQMNDCLYKRSTK